MTDDFPRLADDSALDNPIIFATTIREHGDLGPLYAALAKARKAFAPCVKNCSQTQPYPHEWASLDSIQEATTPALSDNGLVVIQPLAANTVDGWMAITTRLAHASGAYIETEVRAQVHPDTKWAGIGGACSYIRRYCVTGLLNVAPEDDTDAAGADGHPSNFQKSPPKAPSAPQKPPPAPKAAQPAQAPKAPPVKAEPPRPVPREVPEDLPPEAIAAMAEDGPPDAGEVAQNQTITDETAAAIKALLHAINPATGRLRYKDKGEAKARLQEILGHEPKGAMTEAEGCKVLSVLRNEP